MSTPAIHYLSRTGIPFEVLHYEHKEKGAAYAASQIGFPLEKTVKTLVADIGDNRYVIALMPGDKKLDFKKLAAFFQAKRSAMVDRDTAERLTGYLVGGISPFGLKRSFRSAMHESIMHHGTVVINGGQRGTMLKMKPRDIAALLDCSILDIAR
jgi:Cys-tRNA(Pro)/Cys-tRNA(Cys) deacylase